MSWELAIETQQQAIDRVQGVIEEKANEPGQSLQQDFDFMVLWTELMNIQQSQRDVLNRLKMAQLRHGQKAL